LQVLAATGTSAAFTRRINWSQSKLPFWFDVAFSLSNTELLENEQLLETCLIANAPSGYKAAAVNPISLSSMTTLFGFVYRQQQGLKFIATLIDLVFGC
jgi:hypothetical protein